MGVKHVVCKHERALVQPVSPADWFWKLKRKRMCTGTVCQNAFLLTLLKQNSFTTAYPVRGRRGAHFKAVFVQTLCWQRSWSSIFCISMIMIEESNIHRIHKRVEPLWDRTSSLSMSGSFKTRSWKHIRQISHQTGCVPHQRCSSILQRKTGRVSSIAGLQPPLPVAATGTWSHSWDNHLQTPTPKKNTQYTN